MKYYFWGTGEVSEYYMVYLNPNLKRFVRVEGFVDNNKEKEIFFGIKVYRPSEIDFDNNDKIVIMTTAYKNEILEQIQTEKIISMEKVLIIDEFYSDILKIIKKEKKKICFIGDYDTYCRAKYRAALMLYDSCYENSTSKCDRYDIFFLCPPVFEKRGDKIIEYEKCIQRELVDGGVKNENIFPTAIWMSLLFSNISVSFGENNSDKTFYIIATSEPLVGIANLMWLVMTEVKFGRDNKMIPIVDMKNAPNQYLGNDKKNAWEDFFFPVSSVSLDEVYRSKNVVVCGGMPRLTIVPNPNDIKIRPEIEEEIIGFKNRFFPKNERVLGVIYRATDYNNNVLGHATPYDIYEYIGLVKEECNRIQYKYIFLATEVEDAVKEFVKEFGEYVIYTDQKRYSANEKEWLAKIKFDRDNDEYLRGKEYLVVLYLLSQCDSLLSQKNGAQVIAKILNQDKYEYIIDL